MGGSTRLRKRQRWRKRCQGQFLTQRRAISEKRDGAIESSARTTRSSGARLAAAWILRTSPERVTRAAVGALDHWCATTWAVG